jgi:glutaryl-CoA dehydrogenase
LPAMVQMDRLGAFVLHEPEALRTSCRRLGDTWILNGHKTWSGNADFADHIIVWAQDVQDHQIKAFWVDRKTVGISMDSRDSGRFIRWVDCPIAEERRLPYASSFKDVLRVLKTTHTNTAWQALGCAQGIHEEAWAHVQRRQRWSQAKAGLRLIQDLLVEMQSQISAMRTLVTRLSQLQDQDDVSDTQTSLAHMFCVASCKSILSMAQELMGAHGILISMRVAKFLEDVEALSSFEATRHISSSTADRTMTGMSAFP